MNEALKTKYAHIANALAERYGYPTWRQHLPPVEELVNCILSQSTSDTNRDKGYDALIARYPNWETVRDCDVDELIATIRPAGLANQKAPRIQEALRYITEKQGKITLDFLAEMTPAEAREWLTKIHGVGAKTASIVMLFAFGKPAFPVDRHVHRVCQRLGLISEKTSADAAHEILEAIVPENAYYQAHLNIIQHGRTVCQARQPLCERCPLTAWCDYYQKSGQKSRKTVGKDRSVQA